MEHSEKQIEFAFRCAIAGQMYLNQLEELERLGLVVQRRKQIAKRTIRELRLQEKHFDGLDEQIPNKLFGDFINEYDEYIEAVSNVDISKLKEVTKLIKNL